MRKKLQSFLLCLLCFVTAQTFAQTQEIGGQVIDEEGLPIPGVNVVVKNTTVGTVTNFDGEFSLNVPNDDEEIVLVFSSLGFVTQEITVEDTLEVNITMETDVESLDEVVVTALGIEREKKALGYAVQAVQSEKLMEGNSSNLVNGLQGKVSGVTVANSGGAPGASSVIMIRGGSSITGNNQPLFVVDGIPIDNSTNSSLEVASANRASDINPEDIESISVLKGPSAAALYGIQAAEGAVIITTKKGKAGTSIVSYSGSLSFDEVLGAPDVQEMYGQGKQTITETGVTYDTDSPFSWGEQLASGIQTYNHIEDFYTTAVSENHNASYSGGSEKNQVYFSIGDLSQEGVIGGTSYDKTSFKLNTTSTINDDLTIGASANYITTKTNSTKQGNASGGSYSSLLGYPVNVDIQDYLNEDGSQRMIYQDQRSDNPYWSLNNSPNSNQVHRFLGVASLNYNFLNDFNISYKLGTDYYNDFSKRIIGDGSLIENREEGYISQFNKKYRRTTSNFILSYQKELSESFTLDALVGNTVEDLNSQTVYTYGNGFLAPGIYSIGNVKRENQSINEVITRKRTVGVFGELKLAWRDAAFLSATGRNDWSSTLPRDKRSFFYPSVGASAIVTDLLKMGGNDITSPNGLTYLKLRTTWAQVGKDAPIGALESSLSTNINGLASSAYTYNGVNVGNPALEPEFTDSYEIGFDSRFLENRVGLDMSVYYSESDNQILRDIRVPPTAGTFYATLNGGAIVNKGVEAFLSVKVLPRTSDINWNMDFNFGMNRSEVIDLPGHLNEVYLSDSWTFNGTAAGAAILDGSLFGLRGERPMRGDDGQMVIGADGLPTLEVAVFEDVNRLPDWTLGISNSIGYRNFNLSFLLDIVEGNEVYNATKSALAYYGLSENTTDRDETVIFEGVDEAGNPTTVEAVKDQEYYQNFYSRNAENFVEDGSFVRLRYVTLNYYLPQNFLKRFSINSAQVYVTGRNLFTITDYTGVDPEVNTFGAGIAGAGSMGIDNLGTPNTKGVDLGLKFKF